MVFDKNLRILNIYYKEFFVRIFTSRSSPTISFIFFNAILVGCLKYCLGSEMVNNLIPSNLFCLNKSSK